VAVVLLVALVVQVLAVLVEVPATVQQLQRTQQAAAVALTVPQFITVVPAVQVFVT